MIAKRCAAGYRTLVLVLASMLASLLWSAGVARADTPAPVINQPADGASFTTSFITVSGTAIPGAFIKVHEAGENIAEGFSNASGNWSTQSVFRTGTHTITATAFDIGMGGSPESAPRTITVEVGIQPPFIFLPTQNQKINHTDITVEGQADLGTTVTITEGTMPLGTTTASAATGNWSNPLPFAEGTHSIVATASDTATPSATRTFGIDLTPPAAPTIGSPAANSFYNSQDVSSNGTRESGATVDLLLDASTPITVQPGTSTSWVKTLQDLDEGVHTLKARQIDAAGHPGPYTPERTFAVDLSVPTVRITTLNPVFTDSVTVQGDAQDGFLVDHITVSYSGPTSVSGNAACPACPGATVTWTSTRSDLHQGVYTVTAVAVDKAGKQSSPVSIKVVRAVP